MQNGQLPRKECRGAEPGPTRGSSQATRCSKGGEICADKYKPKKASILTHWLTGAAVIPTSTLERHYVGRRIQDTLDQVGQRIKDAGLLGLELVPIVYAAHAANHMPQRTLRMILIASCP